MNKIFTLFSIVFAVSSFTQTVRLEGNLDMDSTSGNLGQFIIYSLPDSNLVKGGYLDSTYFTSIFKTEGNNDFYIKISAYDYADTTLNFTVKDSLVSLSTIKLNRDKTLDQVDVVFIKPEFERTMDGIKVNVQGTNLQTLNTLFDVLVASPKLTSPDDERIEIIGKGSPLILVDRQAIISNDELKAIPANMVESIEIITNPSAKYKAQGRGNGVIEVYTKDFHLQGYNATVSANSGINTQVKPNSGLNLGLNLKKNKFSLSGYLGGNYSQSNGFSTSEGYSTDETQRSLSENGNSENWNSWNYFSIKTAYQINKKQKLTAGIRGHGSLGGSTEESTSSYFTGTQNDLSKTAYTENSNTWLNNKAFLNYTLETDTNKSSLEINLNLALKTSNRDGLTNSVYEDNINNIFSDFDIKIDSKDNPLISEFRVNYEKIFDTTGWKLGYGGSLSLLNNAKVYDQYNLVNNEWVIDQNFSNSYDYQEKIGSIYTEITKAWDKVSVRLGATGEYTGLSGYSNSLEKQFIDSSYFMVFPSASIMLEPKDILGITLSYSSGIVRPQFSNYDPFVRIQDSLYVSYGNPYLKPEIQHTFGVDFDLFYAYSFSISYVRTKQAVADLQFVDDSTFLINTTPSNIDHDNTLYFSANLPLQFDWLTGWNSIWMGYSQFVFTPEYQREPYSNLLYGIYSYWTFKLPHNFDIMNRLNISKWGSPNFSTNTRISWGMRFSKKMYDNKFQIYLDIGDIIPPKYVYNEVAGNYNSTSNSQYAFTHFKLGLWFKFGRLKRAENIKESSSGQSDRI